MSELVARSDMTQGHPMHWLRIRLFADSPFATPLRGDTLFGQLCWRIREVAGEQALTQLLDGYLEQKPFVVISDPFAADHLPRPQAPAYLFGFDKLDAKKRKEVKGKRWLPLTALELPLHQWAHHLRSNEEVLKAAGHRIASLQQTEFQSHNSINRLTMTTGDEFAPYSSEQHWLHPELGLDIYILHDDRISAETLILRLNEIGLLGYGKDATIGKGRFHVQPLPMPNLPDSAESQMVLTLAPCAPQSGEWHQDNSFYSPMVRFGRHGTNLVIQGKPYKNPLLLADTAALLVPHKSQCQPFVGMGLGGDGVISPAMPQTVHQGYAPVVGVQFVHQGQGEQ